jgi:hypothetical protein
MKRDKESERAIERVRQREKERERREKLVTIITFYAMYFRHPFHTIPNYHSTL